MIFFVVPGEPVPKARARTFALAGGGMKTTTPTRTKQAEERVRQYLYVARPGLRPSAALFEVSLSFHLHGVGRGDWDNYAKLVCDALNHVVWADDHQVRKASVALISDCVVPRTLVEIREVAA